MMVNMNNATNIQTETETETKTRWAVTLDGEPCGASYGHDRKPSAKDLAWHGTRNGAEGKEVGLLKVISTKTTTPVTVRRWSETRTSTHYRTFQTRKGEQLVDSKGRSVGTLVSFYDCEIVEDTDKQIQHQTIAADDGREISKGAPWTPHTEDEPTGTKAFGVKLQSARAGECFGASFPKLYRFATEAERDTHIEKKLAAAQRRQWKRQEQGKL